MRSRIEVPLHSPLEAHSLARNLATTAGTAAAHVDASERGLERLKECGWSCLREEESEEVL
jgi:hypothetical protein